MSKISDNFQRWRWSEVRKQIDAMKPGTTLRFTCDKYFNVKSSVEHLSDAYDGERPPWKMKVANGCITVTTGEHI